MKTADPNVWWEALAPSPDAPTVKVEISDSDRGRLNQLFGSAVALSARIANFNGLSEDDRARLIELFPDFDHPRLASPAANERAQAIEVASAKAKHERETWEAQRTADQVARNESDARAAADVAARAEATRQELAAKIGPELQSALDPLVAAFRLEPTRKLAMRVAETWARFAERCEAELGQELHEFHLAAPFYAGQLQKSGARVHSAALEFHSEHMPVCWNATAAIKAFRGGDPATVIACVEQLERSVVAAVAVANPAASALNAAKFEAMCANASRPDLVAALATLNAECERLKLERASVTIDTEKNERGVAESRARAAGVRGLVGRIFPA